MMSKSCCETTMHAAMHNHVHCLKILHRYGTNIKWDEQVCEMAAYNGSLEVLRYLRKHHCPWDDYSYEAAVDSSQIEVLKYLFENNCPIGLGSHVMSACAVKGDLNILKYLHSIGFYWNEQVCAHAVEHNHFDMLKYLHVNNCPWDETSCILAVANKG